MPVSCMPGVTFAVSVGWNPRQVKFGAASDDEALVFGASELLWCQFIIICCLRC